MVIFFRVVAYAGILLSTLASKVEAKAGGSIAGNGGGVVHCRQSFENAFQGDYFLDYLATYVESNQNQDVVSIQTWEESKSRILKGLETIAPEMYIQFQSFLKGMENYTDAAQPRIWLEASFGLINLEDQSLFRHIPSNCRGKNNQPQFTQFIRRSVTNDQIVYEFDPKIYETLKQQYPLQFSFAVIHEFLWDYAQNPDLIRRMNRILHSEKLTSYDQRTFQNVVKRLGMNRVLTNGASISHLNQADLDKNLLRDIKLGNMDFVRHWLSLGASPNARDENGDTALIFAAAYNRTEMVKLLIGQGAFVRAKNSLANTAFSNAVEKDYLEIVKILVSHGADIYEKDTNGCPPVHHTLDPELLTYLVALGLDINSSCDDGKTPLVWHLSHNKNFLAKDAELLISLGADPNIPDSTGRTSIHTLIEGNRTAGDRDVSILKQLIAAGVNLDRKWNGSLPIVQVFEKMARPDDFAEEMVLGGVDLEMEDSLLCSGDEGYIILDDFDRRYAKLHCPADRRDNGDKISGIEMLLAKTKSKKLIETVVKRKINLNRVFRGFYYQDHPADIGLFSEGGFFRINLLGLAAIRGQPGSNKSVDDFGMMDLLLQAGADVNQMPPEHGGFWDSDKKYFHYIAISPLMAAALAGNKKGVEALLAHGAKVDLRDQYGNTALHYAAVGGDVSVAHSLILAGADPGARSNHRTPYSLIELWKMSDYERREWKRRMIKFLERFRFSDISFSRRAEARYRWYGWSTCDFALERAKSAAKNACESTHDNVIDCRWDENPQYGTAVLKGEKYCVATAIYRGKKKNF